MSILGTRPLRTALMPTSAAPVAITYGGDIRYDDYLFSPANMLSHAMPRYLIFRRVYATLAKSFIMRMMRFRRWFHFRWYVPMIFLMRWHIGFDVYFDSGKVTAPIWYAPPALYFCSSLACRWGCTGARHHFITGRTRKIIFTIRASIIICLFSIPSAARLRHARQKKRRSRQRSAIFLCDCHTLKN